MFLSSCTHRARRDTVPQVRVAAISRLDTVTWSLHPLHLRAPQQTAPLFDHVIGAREDRRGHVEPERLGSGQVDDEIELGWLLDRQVARLRSMQNLVDIVGRAPE